jgi:hypothetical protein
VGTPTLFGDSEDVAATVTRPPEHVVRELVDRFGLAEAGVRGMTDRQAFAVLRRKKQEAAASPARARSGGSAETGRPSPATPPPPPLPRVDRGASTPERWQAANELADMLDGGPDRGIPWERRCGRLAAGLYVLSQVEWDDVLAGVVARLRADRPVTPEGSA